MALAYELAEQGAMNEEEDADWHKNYLKRLRASLMPAEQTVSRSTSPFSHAAPRYQPEVEVLPAASTMSCARMITQVEHMELNEAQMSDIFPELTEFLRHLHRHQSDTFSQNRTDSQQKLPEITASASSTRTPREPIERATNTLSVAHSASMQLLRQKQKRMASRDSDSSTRSNAKGSNNRKLLDQILEGEDIEEQIEMIRQQELKCVPVPLLYSALSAFRLLDSGTLNLFRILNSIAYSYGFSERHRTHLLRHIRMSLIDRSGLGTGATGKGSEPQGERSRRLQYNDEVRAVEAFILVEEIMRRRYNVSVRNLNFIFFSFFYCVCVCVCL